MTGVGLAGMTGVGLAGMTGVGLVGMTGRLIVGMTGRLAKKGLPRYHRASPKDYKNSVLHKTA